MQSGGTALSEAQQIGSSQSTGRKKALYLKSFGQAPAGRSPSWGTQMGWE